jgi:hypothetical protein
VKPVGQFCSDKPESVWLMPGGVVVLVLIVKTPAGSAVVPLHLP